MSLNDSHWENKEESYLSLKEEIRKKNQEIKELKECNKKDQRFGGKD